MSLVSFFLDKLTDRYVRENFQKLSDFLDAEAVLGGKFQFRTIHVPTATTNFKFAHNLGYTPKDIIVTSATGSLGVPFSGTLTWNYDRFDKTNLDLTVTGEVFIRVYLGSAE